MRTAKILFVASLLVFAFAFLVAGTVSAQSGSYHQTNVVSDMQGGANLQSAGLVNPWGMAFKPGQPFWIVENGTGAVAAIDPNGTPEGTFGIPAPPADQSTSTPSGIVYNSTTSFPSGGVGLTATPSQFLFATEDGTISDWATANGYVPAAATIAIDHSTAGAVYKGLAILSPSCCATYLAAANFHDNFIETFTGLYDLLSLGANAYLDPNLPAGYAPFNIQQVGNQVFVMYAMQDSAKHDPVLGAGNGIVDIFALDGTFVQRFASNGPLNAPWGVAQASANFGPFSNDILIGNFGDGVINAFDPATGNFLGALKDSTGAVITNSGLWALVFRNDGVGDPNTLYFTAGLANEQHGLFGAIAFASSSTTADFTLAASPTTATVTAGQSVTISLTATPANGFTGNVAFSCTAPTGVTCNFNPATVNVTSGGAGTTLTLGTSATVTRYGAMAGSMLPLFLVPGLGFLLGNRRRRGARFSLLGVAAGVVLFTMLFVSTGCGGYGSKSTTTNRGTASVLVTAQAGSVSHTTTISVTVQ